MRTNKNTFGMIRRNIYEIQSLLVNQADVETYFNEVKCDCCIPWMAERLTNKNTNDLPRIFTRLFSMTYIDQAMYSCLMDAKNPECLNESELYHQYRKRFPFPKFWVHGARGMTSPERFIARGRFMENHTLYEQKKLIFKNIQLYWDKGVKKFLTGVGRCDVANIVEKEMRMDLSLRHRYSEETEMILTNYVTSFKEIN